MTPRLSVCCSSFPLQAAVNKWEKNIIVNALPNQRFRSATRAFISFWGLQTSESQQFYPLIAFFPVLVFN